MDEKKVKKLNDNQLLKSLFNAVTEEDVLTQHGRDLYLGRKKLDDKTRAQLVVDANLLRSMDLWQILCNCMKHEANKQLYTVSKTTDDMIFGKAMLLTVDIFEKKVRNLAAL